MREILFRGKTLSGKWVEGAYYKQELFYGDKEDAHIIITSKETLDNDFALERYIVIPETIGQYTGLTDKNGTKIFEGDIVLCKIIGVRETVIHKGFIEYIEDCFGVNIKGIVPTQHCLVFSMKNGDVEVIGNIHDNPELLKGGEG